MTDWSPPRRGTAQVDVLSRQLRRAVAADPLCRVFSALPRDPAVKFGLRPAPEAALLCEEPAAVNLFRFGSTAEVWAADWRSDAVAARGYAECLAALADWAAVRRMLVGCCGDEKDRDGIEADVRRFRDRVHSLRVPLGPREAAQFLAGQQRVAAHQLVLALQRARELFVAAGPGPRPHPTSGIQRTQEARTRHLAHAHPACRTCAILTSF